MRGTRIDRRASSLAHVGSRPFGGRLCSPSIQDISTKDRHSCCPCLRMRDYLRDLAARMLPSEWQGIAGGSNVSGWPWSRHCAVPDTTIMFCCGSRPRNDRRCGAGHFSPTAADPDHRGRRFRQVGIRGCADQAEGIVVVRFAQFSGSRPDVVRAIVERLTEAESRLVGHLTTIEAGRNTAAEASASS